MTLPAHGCADAIAWSADGKHFAFRNTAADAVELWIGDVSSAHAHGVSGLALNPFFDLALLQVPVQVPVLLATVSATQALLLGQPLGDVAHWLKLLAGADAVYLTIGLLTFEFVLEG